MQARWWCDAYRDLDLEMEELPANGWIKTCRWTRFADQQCWDSKQERFPARDTDIKWITQRVQKILEEEWPHIGWKDSHWKHLPNTLSTTRAKAWNTPRTHWRSLLKGGWWSFKYKAEGLDSCPYGWWARNRQELDASSSESNSSSISDDDWNRLYISGTHRFLL